MQAWTEFDKRTGVIIQSAFGVGLVKPPETDKVGILHDVQGHPHKHYVCPYVRQLKDLPNPYI
jgi:hypothetical protein